MKKIVLLYFTLITFLNVYGQAVPTKKEQYDFLRWYVKHKKMPPLSDTSVKLDNSTILRSLNKILLSSHKITRSDYLYIRKQALQSTRQVIDTGLLKNVVWRTDFHQDTLYRYISMPIFSSNKKIVLVLYGNGCGFDCGMTSMDAFIKTKGNKWKPLNVMVPVIVY